MYKASVPSRSNPIASLVGPVALMLASAVAAWAVARRSVGRANR